jgi:hypothetical protein
MIFDALLHRLRGAAGDSALSTFIRPNLGDTPAPLRRVLEPIVAASALLAMVVLAGFGALGFGAMLIAAGLIYLIITQVFGIQLDLVPPSGA